jgi:hypothetical protein
MIFTYVPLRVARRSSRLMVSFIVMAVDGIDGGGEGFAARQAAMESACCG